MFLKARSPGTLRNITWWAKMDSNDYQSCELLAHVVEINRDPCLLLAELNPIS